MSGFSEANLDSSDFLSSLLLTALTAARAGLFYSPLAAIVPDQQFVGKSDRKHTPEKTWSINVGTLFGMTESPRDPMDLMPYILESDRHILMECAADAISHRRPESECEFRIRRPNGETRWISSRILIGVEAKSGTEYLASMLFDATEYKEKQLHVEQLRDQLNAAQKYLIAALQVAGVAIFRYAVNPDNVHDLQSYGSWNYNVASIFGYPADALMTPNMQIKRMRPEDQEAMIKIGLEAMALKKDHEYQYEFPIQLDDASTRWLLSRCTTEVDGEGRPQYVSGAVIDITERKAAEEKTRYVATHDVLTGLPNRFVFGNLLNHTIETSKRYQNKFAVLFIDLDRFKSVNDAFGHHAGDQLLIEISQRFRKCLRASDVLARISGDEFVVIAPELTDEESAAVVARKLIAEAFRPILLLGQKCQISASIGICIYPKDGEDEQMLLRNADAAMYVAKEAGKNNYQFFNADNTSQSLERMAMENELRTALLNNELSLQYQAKLDLHSDQITGVEALLRWNNHQFGSVSPAIFIPMAEETGLIVPIGHWVLKTACKQNVEWQKQGMAPICVSVNISARQFMSKDLLSNIKEALDESGMAPELLELEITESMVMHHVDAAIALLDEIKALGARIAIDDFGTGYSSLAQLKRFPIDTLKVDRSFIREVVHDPSDQAITEAIIAMGKSLSLTIIAEGVETKEQQEFLRNRACDEMQGFYFSKPVPPSQFLELFKQHEKVSRH